MAGEMLKPPENPKATSTLVLPVFADGEQYGDANQAFPTNTGPNMTTLDHSQHSTELIGQSYEEDGKGNSDEEPDEEDDSDVDDYSGPRIYHNWRHNSLLADNQHLG